MFGDQVIGCKRGACVWAFPTKQRGFYGFWFLSVIEEWIPSGGVG